MARDYLRRSLIAAAVTGPAAIVGSILVSQWFLALFAVPPAVYALPDITLRDRAAQRKESTDAELPFFSLAVGVLAGAGVPLYSILEEVAKGDFFSLRKEALLVKRDVAVFGMNPVDAIERMALGHPSARFKEFLLGCTSKIRSGGDLGPYLAAESASLLGGVKEGWARYVSRIGLIGSMMVTAFGVVPLLLLVAGVFSPGFSILGLVAYAGVAVPFMTAGLVVLAGRLQPMKLEMARGRTWAGLAAAIPISLAAYHWGNVWESLALGSIAFFVVYGMPVRTQLSEARDFEQGLSRFLKDILEFKRRDYDLARAVVAVSGATEYPAAFDKVLSEIAAQLRMGAPLDEVKVRCRSRIGKLIFHLLGQMARSGGGTVDTVNQLSTFVDRVKESMRETSAEMKPYLALSYLSPLLLAFGVAFVGGVSTSLGGMSKIAEGIGQSGLQFGAVPGALEQTADVLIVASSASLGLIATKITDMTIRNTAKAAVNVLVAAIAVAVVSFVGPHSLGHLL